MHADSCEDKLDAPLMYEAGWGKKLSYVIAFSAFEVVDVTRRYTRKWQEVLDRRSLVSEEWLEKKLDLMNQMVMSSLPPMVWDPMIQRKQLEIQELEETLFLEAEQTPKEENLKPEEQEGRISGSKDWKDSRGESGKPKSEIEDGTCAVPGRPGQHIPVVR
jgi:peptide-N4-(N-acetyl-beta-glucosaminyl)asparagine amidase